MGVEVAVQGKIVYRSSFPICKMIDLPESEGRRQRILAFRFTGGHVFQGSLHTTSAQTVEGNLWQAGTDSDDLVVGVSFKTAKRILLNTVCFAPPGRASSSEVDAGIEVKTFPVIPK